MSGTGDLEARLYLGDSRRMEEVASGCVDLVVTSPPYWSIKDYGSARQIGHGEDLHAYLRSLFLVWSECFRALRAGGRLCVNIGDQFARATSFGRYRVIPLHAEIISQSLEIGYDFLGSIIWRKKTTLNTSGGAPVMGSFPYPPNGIVELDYEYIHIFKKPGAKKVVSPQRKSASALDTKEWKTLFSGHWDIGGARKKDHEAVFPDEIPRRLIRMFSFIEDVVLDPFLGTGTTASVALSLGRNAIGYEINSRYMEIAREKVDSVCGLFAGPARILRAESAAGVPVSASYVPRMPNLSPPRGDDSGAPNETLRKVIEVLPDLELLLEGGDRVRLLGIRVADSRGAADYLTRRILGKRVYLRDVTRQDGGSTAAYVYLKNRISVNKHLLTSGLAVPDPKVDHRLKAAFARFASGQLA